MTQPTCAIPLDAPLLAEYWLAALSPDEEASIEEHLFTCDTCGARLDETIALAESLRALARSGSLMMTVPQSFLDHASPFLGSPVTTFRNVYEARCPAA